MIQTLIPAPAAAEGRYKGQWSRIVSTTLTPRALCLLGAGVLAAVPGFFGVQHWSWLLVAWDAVVTGLVLVEAMMLPGASAVCVTRTFLDSPLLGGESRVELAVEHSSKSVLRVHFADDLHPALAQLPPSGVLTVFPGDPVRTTFVITPTRRGDFTLGAVFLRWTGIFGFTERRAFCRPGQKVRVYPAMEGTGNDAALYLLRVRQIELQRRRLRLTGTGREFDHLRDYRAGDELRNISWTATARRAKLVTREFTAERSQQVWIVIDAGRLSGTAFELRYAASGSEGGAARAFSDSAADESFLLSLTQLDQACGAGVALAQTVMQAGDKAGLLVYGRGIQQQLLPATGTGSLRAIIDALAQARVEGSEADHLCAAARLGHLQRRRGLILWITEIPDGAHRPEIADAVLDIARRHLVLLVVLHHPEVRAMAAREPQTAAQMFESAAAQEVLERRRQSLAMLRTRGVLVVETTPGAVRTDAINEYLEVKARGLL